MLSIYDYDSPREFLAATLVKKQAVNPRFSLRAWSKQLGLKGPTLLSRILKGERSITAKTCSTIGHSLKMDTRSQRYFEVLVLRSNSNTLEEKNLYENLLFTIRPNRELARVELESFRFISDWYHLAILELVETKGFVPQAAWIAQRLNNKITEVLAEKAFSRLVRLGFINKLKDGSYQRCTEGQLQIRSRSRTLAIQRHHSQVMDLAQKSLAEQSPNDRHLMGSMIPIAKENYPAVVDLIEEFHQRILKFADYSKANEIYELSTQFFSLTTPSRNSEKGKRDTQT